MFKVIKTHKTSFHATRKVLNQLFQCNRISGQIWNDVLTLAQDCHKQTNKWINKKMLHLATKGKYPIHSQSIQGVYEDYLQARENALEARKKGYLNIRYPWRKKKHFNTKWKKDGYRIYPGGKIELSLGTWEGKRLKPLTLYVKDLPKGTIKEIELVYDRGLKLAISYEDGIAPEENSGSNMAAIDPGEIHSIAAVCENGEGIIITGRKLRSIRRIRNKKQKELQRLMSRCKKGSRQWRKYRRALNYILAKSNAQLTDALHKITRNFVNWCVENQVKEVIHGDVEGVQRNTARKKKNPKKKQRSRRFNQKLSQWQFGKSYNYLEYKLAAKGTSIKKRDESYTTQTCPVCGRRKKVSGRVYKCHCGYREHRDIHSSKNILTLEKHGEFRDFVINKVMYLRIA